MSPLLLGMLMALCLVLEAFYSGAEVAMASADRLRLRHQAGKGNRGARLALAMLDNPVWLLATTRVGSYLALVTNITLATLLALDLFGPGRGWLGVVVLAPVVWVAGELAPRGIAQQRADYLAPWVSYPLKVSGGFFFPVLLLFSGLARLVARLTGEDPGRALVTLREELDLVLRQPATGGDVHPVEKRMIRRLFNFSEARVRDVMIPLIDVASVEVRATCGQALHVAGMRAHARLPVHAQRVEQLVGMINSLDLLGLDDDAPIKPHLRPLRFVPGSRRLEPLLALFRQSGERMAAVVDEYGACQGIITLEDILERVVGQLRDEYDVHQPDVERIRRLDPRTHLVSARIHLVTLRDELGIVLPEGNYETLGGFLLEHWQRIPEEGESLAWQGFTFGVEKASKKAIAQVRITQGG